MKDMKMKELVGKIFTSVEASSASKDEIVFIESDGTRYRMFHEEDCCESVSIEDINGNLSDLVGSPILMAEEESNSTDPQPADQGDDSWTWTFYRFATSKGYVTIRWFGCSNGYYSESVTFAKEE